MKAECIWCETPNKTGPRGMFYIHQKCFFEVDNMKDKIDYAIKYAKGEMPRVLANGDKQGYASIEKFLVAVDDFNRRWEGTVKLIHQLKQTNASLVDEPKKEAKQ